MVIKKTATTINSGKDWRDGCGGEAGKSNSQRRPFPTEKRMVIRYMYISIRVHTVLNIYMMSESGLEFEKEYASLKSASISRYIYLKYRLLKARCRICK